MPNWVTHKLTLSGKPQMLRLFVERHLKPLDEQKADDSTASQEHGDQTGQGSPECTERPQTSADEPAPQERIPFDAVYPDGTVKEEIRIPTGPVLDFETLLPLGDRDPSDVWDTKWNASMGRISGDPASGSVTIWFDTPWSIPQSIFDAIAEKYPELKVEGHAFDELWNFAATILIEDGSADVEQVDATVELYREVYGKNPENMPEHAMSLKDTLQQFLNDNEWKDEIHHNSNIDADYVVTSYTIDGQLYNLFLIARNQPQFLSVSLICPLRVPKGRAREAAFVLNFLNTRMQVGNLEMDEDGEIKYRWTIDVEGTNPSPRQYGSLLAAAVGCFDELRTAAIGAAAYSKESANDIIKDYIEAVEKAEAEPGGVDRADSEGNDDVPSEL